MEKLKNFWDKIKGLKHIHIIIAVVIAAILVAGYFAFGVGGKKSSDKSNSNSTQELSAVQEYVKELENKLDNVLSKISGAGKVDSIITLQSGFSFVYATDTQTKTVTSGETSTTTTVEEVVLVGGQPVVLSENYPVIQGVVIVATGAENFAVKMKLLEAAQILLEIDEEAITILY